MGSVMRPLLNVYSCVCVQHITVNNFVLKYSLVIVSWGIWNHIHYLIKWTILLPKIFLRRLTKQNGLRNTERINVRKRQLDSWDLFLSIPMQPFGRRKVLTARGKRETYACKEKNGTLCGEAGHKPQYNKTSIFSRERIFFGWLVRALSWLWLTNRFWDNLRHSSRRFSDCTLIFLR